MDIGMTFKEAQFGLAINQVLDFESLSFLFCSSFVIKSLVTFY